MISATAFLIGFFGIAQALHGWEVDRPNNDVGVGNIWPRSIFHEMWNICHEDNCHGHKVFCYRCVDGYDIILEAKGKYQGGWDGREKMIEALFESLGEDGGEYLLLWGWRAYSGIIMKRSNGDYVVVKVIRQPNAWWFYYDKASKVKVGNIEPRSIFQELWNLCHEDHCSGYRKVGTLENGKNVIIKAKAKYKGGWSTRKNMLESFFAEINLDNGIWYSLNIFDLGWRTLGEIQLFSRFGNALFSILVLSDQDFRDFEIRELQHERELAQREQRNREQQEKERKELERAHQLQELREQREKERQVQKQKDREAQQLQQSQQKHAKNELSEIFKIFGIPIYLTRLIPKQSNNRKHVVKNQKL